jgi:hypothetical protein
MTPDYSYLKATIRDTRSGGRSRAFVALIGQQDGLDSGSDGNG